MRDRELFDTIEHLPAFVQAALNANGPAGLPLRIEHAGQVFAVEIDLQLAGAPWLLTRLTSSSQQAR